MRTFRVLALTIAVIVVSALTFSAVAGEGDKPAPTTGQAAEMKGDAKKVKEESKPVMATLTYINDAGKSMTKQVEYLPEGRKVATLETSKGTLKIELWDDKAPNTVVNFVNLANSGRYDGVEFHRVIDGFMAQTGDVQHRMGTGGPGYSIPGEFDESLKHERGVVSMARASDPDSGGSQFFIMFAAAPHLDGKYAAFGKVIEGMDVIDKITKGDGPNGSFQNADMDKIVKLRVKSVPEKDESPGKKTEGK
jgi:cyclophilin family peptidyl-prolyl cis-trans isomerase